MTAIKLKPGARTEVLNLFSDSLAQTIRFDVTPESGPVSGKIEVERALIPFLKPHVDRFELAAENALHKRWIDGSYKVYVTSDNAAMLALKSRHLTRNRLFLILLVVAALGLIAGIMPLLFAN